MSAQAQTSTEPAEEAGIAREPHVDPRAPRFGQSITAVGLLSGIALREPLLVYAVTVVLVAAVASGWRLDAYGTLWRTGVARLAGTPTEREPAAPHRFAQLLGGVGTTVASALLLASGTFGTELAILGFAVAGVVAALAGLAAATGVCVGCRLYRQVETARRLDLV